MGEPVKPIRREIAKTGVKPATLNDAADRLAVDVEMESKIPPESFLCNAHGSLNSPLCSCISITSPAAS
jgi:hypothetical protein